MLPPTCPDHNIGWETAPEARNTRGPGKADFDRITHIWTGHMSLSKSRANQLYPAQVYIPHQISLYIPRQISYTPHKSISRAKCIPRNQFIPHKLVILYKISQFISRTIYLYHAQNQWALAKYLNT